MVYGAVVVDVEEVEEVEDVEEVDVEVEDVEEVEEVVEVVVEEVVVVVVVVKSFSCTALTNFLIRGCSASILPNTLALRLASRALNSRAIV